MEEGKGQFLSELSGVLAERVEYTERKELPRLREQFHAYQNGLQSVINVLLRKSFIREDPYKHDQKISEVSLPPTDPVLESDKVDRISARLSTFESELDFVNSLYQFRLDFLTIGRIRVLADLVRWVAWDKLTDLSGSINTRLVAELVNKVKQGGDTLSAGIIQDAHNQLTKSTGEILRILRDLSSLQRERYKLDMRTRLFAGLAVTPEAIQNRREELMKSLKTRYSALLAAEKPTGEQDTVVAYYPELIGEILDEDFGNDSGMLRTQIIERLRVREEKQKKKGEESLKPLLLEAVRFLSSAGISIQTAADRLSSNNDIVETRKMSFGERFRRWIRKKVLGDRYIQLFEIEIVDPTTAAKHKEEINFKEFASRMLKRSRVLAGLSMKMSPGFDKLAESNEESIVRFLDTNINEIHQLLAKLPALDNYFKEAVGGDERSRVRGIKAETGAIKTAVVKAIQKKHEYLSRKEEIDQMKKLGIDVT